MSASTIAEIMESPEALASACLELADALTATAETIERTAAGEAVAEMALERLLPAMCAFPSPAAMRQFCASLRTLAGRLETMPRTAEEAGALLSGPEEDFQAFERLLFTEGGGDD